MILNSKIPTVCSVSLSVDILMSVRFKKINHSLLRTEKEKKILLDWNLNRNTEVDATAALKHLTNSCLFQFQISLPEMSALFKLLHC